MSNSLKQEHAHGTCDERYSQDNLRQNLGRRLLHDLRARISAVLGSSRPALTELGVNSEAQFQRQCPEYEPGFAMQDMFDLSLTWDDLQFLRTAHILPLATIEKRRPE